MHLSRPPPLRPHMALCPAPRVSQAQLRNGLRQKETDESLSFMKDLVVQHAQQLEALQQSGGGVALEAEGGGGGGGGDPGDVQLQMLSLRQVCVLFPLPCGSGGYGGGGSPSTAGAHLPHGPDGDVLLKRVGFGGQWPLLDGVYRCLLNSCEHPFGPLRVGVLIGGLAFQVPPDVRSCAEAPQGRAVPRSALPSPTS